MEGEITSFTRWEPHCHVWGLLPIFIPSFFTFIFDLTAQKLSTLTRQKVNWALCLRPAGFYPVLKKTMVLCWISHMFGRERQQATKWCQIVALKPGGGCCQARTGISESFWSKGLVPTTVNLSTHFLKWRWQGRKVMNGIEWFLNKWFADKKQI